MTAKELLSDSIAPLNTTDTASFALTLMDEYMVTHLPVVDNGEYLGLVSEADILTHNHTDLLIFSLLPNLVQVQVAGHQHLFDVITMFSSDHLSLLPVVDGANHYLGAITPSNLIRYLSDLFAINNPGGVIVLEVNEKDYLLTEIAQIVESNDTKVLSMYLNSIPDSTRLEITLKLNKMDIDPVLQTLSRYNYSVKATYSENSNDEGLMERFDSLLKYLNV
jgi:predicted transcriptional regulator